MEYGQRMEQSAKITAGDRRLTMNLMGLWQGLRRGAKSCTPAEDFLTALTEDLWADCCLVEIADDSGWLVSRIGGTIARRSGVEAIPVKIEDLLPQSLLAASVRGLEESSRTGVPILEEGEVEDEFGRPALFRSILLPLADEKGRTVQFVAGARFRIRRENA